MSAPIGAVGAGGESGDTRGLTQRELILEMRGMLNTHIAQYGFDQIRAERELGKRPTRAEVLGWITASAALMTAVGALVVL